MALNDLQQLHDWLENRQPLIDDFQALVAAVHDEPWPEFRVTGSAYDMKTGVLRPTYEGVPAGRVAYTVGEGPMWSAVVELAARITAVRSRRWYPITRTVKPIPPAWQGLAIEAFPFLTHMEIGHGWADLMIAAAGWITEIGPPAGFRSSEIKEKYGDLRWYFDGPDDGIADILESAELLSGHICDKCGRPGELRTEGTWLMMRCGEHA